MLYIVEVSVSRKYLKEIFTHVPMSETKHHPVEAEDEQDAKDKVEFYYYGKDSDSVQYNISIVNVNELIK